MEKIAVIGAGIAGLSVSWHLLQLGYHVDVFSDEVEPVTDLAAGMVMPSCELAPSEKIWFDIFCDAAKYHHDFLCTLFQNDFSAISRTAPASISLAANKDGQAIMYRWRDLMKNLGFALEPLSNEQLQNMEPALCRPNLVALRATGEYAIDPKSLRLALQQELMASGHFFCFPEKVTSVTEDKLPRVYSSSLPAGRQYSAVVYAAGLGNQIKLPTPLPLRAVKGQILTVQGPVNLLRHPLRVWDRFPVYLVPRNDGRIVIGATCEEREDQVVTAGGVMELLFAAWNILPEIFEFPITSINCGLRHATPDNMPLVGELSPGSRIFVLAGLYRHGILLAPYLAKNLAALIADKNHPWLWDQLSINRLQRAA